MTDEIPLSAKVAEIEIERYHPAYQDKPHGRVEWFRVIMAMLMFSILVAYVWVNHRPPPYAPLGDYPVQTIDLAKETVVLPAESGTTVSSTSPALHVTPENWGQVPVSGVKCVREATHIIGSYQWQAVRPPGLIEEVGHVDLVNPVADKPATPRVQGCTTFAFRNEIPARIRTRILELAHSGFKNTEWQLHGVEFPIDGDGNVGIRADWETVNFVIVCDCE